MVGQRVFTNSFDPNILVFKENEPILSIDFIFMQMTNNTYMEQMVDVISHP